MQALVLLSLLAAPPQQAPIQITSGLAIGGVSTGGRAPVGVDAVQSRIAAGTWQLPHDGDALQGPRGEQKWHAVSADKDGWLNDQAFGGGYFSSSFTSSRNAPMILEAAGHTLVYVNGVLRAGDPYGYGYLKIPFMAKQGQNDLLFACGRGRMRASVTTPASPVMLDTGDMTMPDVTLDTKNLMGAIVVINAREVPLRGASLNSGGKKTAVPEIPAMGVRKVRVDMQPPTGIAGNEVKIPITLTQGRQVLDRKVVTLRFRQPNQSVRRTFVSAIDGSVQYYAVVPAQKPSRDNALVLTLHGASVEGQGQADAYAAKDWASIVAATNRRPYGFDWEDWGRIDALEVLSEANRTIPHDPQRVHLTGHSMGGHGTWAVGSLYPGLFASIGPSAGWVSFWSYAGGYQPRNPSAVEQMMLRSMGASDTLARVRNVLSEAVYVLHGDADDNVPVEQARSMKKVLEPIHKDFQYHEQPGAGHWWGNECVDWPPLFDMIKSRRIDPNPRHIEFWTPNPAVSSTDGWITVEQQIEPLKPSSVVADLKEDGTVSVVTTNVARLRLDPKVGKVRSITVDGSRISASSVGSFERNASGWMTASSLSGEEKSPKRSGPFKQAFANRFLLVYGTKGTDAENEWARNKARYDAETFYYRGNGSVDVVADADLDMRRTTDRNVILYGNEETNAVWKKLLKGCPIQVSRGFVKAGDQTFRGDNLVSLFLFPKAGSGTALVGAIGATGLAGMRAADRLPYFTSGVAYPDWTVMSTDVFTLGAGGIKGAGFFDNKWKFSSDAAWNR